MARLLICAVLDKAADCYGRPYAVPTAGVAIRLFQDEVNRESPDNPLNRHPDDFDLYSLAEMDDHTGQLVVNGGPTLIVRARQVYSKVQS